MSARLTLLLLLAATTAGCGRVGALEQPAPLFGERARADYEAQQAARRAEDARGDAAAAADADADNDDTVEDFRRPRTDERDPAQRLDPASQAPSGGINDPFGAPPPVRP
jgi:hypothetical protein